METAKGNEETARLEVERLEALIAGDSDAAGELQDRADALKNAQAALDAKDREVKGIESEIAAYTEELKTATEQLEAAEELLENSANLLQQAIEAEEALKTADQDYQAALKRNDATYEAMKKAEAACTALEEQEDAQLDIISDLDEEKTRLNNEEVTPADTAYRVALSALDPNEYDADRIQKINDAEAALDEAKKAYNIANTRDIEANAAVELAKDMQANAEASQVRVNAFTYDTDSANLITEPGYEYLNDYIDEIRAAEASLTEKAQIKSDAEKDMKNKELAYTAATNELDRAIAAVAVAQADYDRLVGNTGGSDDSGNSGNSGNSGSSGNTGTSNNLGKPGNSSNTGSGSVKSGSQNLGNNGNSGNKNGNNDNFSNKDDADGNQGSAEESAEEATVIEASFDTNMNSSAKKDAFTNGFDPLFVGIVGSVMAIAVVAAIAAAVMRSRRAKSQTSDEEA